MPDPKDSKAPTIVQPTKPTQATEAFTTDPGQLEELREAGKEVNAGNYGSTKVKKHNKNSKENKDKKNWVEVELVDEDGNPIPGKAVEITLPDKSVAAGGTDAKGKFKVTNIDPGNCDITFPDLDKEAWEPA